MEPAVHNLTEIMPGRALAAALAVTRVAVVTALILTAIREMQVLAAVAGLEREIDRLLELVLLWAVAAVAASDF